jgi:putative spermidine/putrescine transport system permease protein
MGTPFVRLLLRIWAGLVILFLLFPIFIVCLYAFNPAASVQSWPLEGLTTHWFHVAFNDQGMLDALWLSVQVGLVATAIALVLGSLAAFGVHRFRFFGRESVSFLLVLPIALPGIVTAVALRSAFNFVGIRLSMLTIVIAHATFCIVVIYNNVIARLRRSTPSLWEASMDLGAHGWLMFRTVTFPVLSTAVVAGGLLAFALSFDEVIVTTIIAGAQNTLPLWIWGSLRLGQKLTEVNAVVVLVLLVTVIPVTISVRLAGAGAVGRGGANAATSTGVATAEAEAVP